MRLTKKKEYGYMLEIKGVDTSIGQKAIIIGDTANKLGQLEDIEDELGIDLLTFSKLLYALDKECVYVKVKKTKQYNGYSVDEETGEIERNIIARFSRYANGTREWFFTISFGNISSVNHYLLKDYGKTWALTKEELEK